MSLIRVLLHIVPYVISGVVFMLSLIYLWCKYKYTHWMRLGVEYVEPSFPFGNFNETFFGRQEIGSVFADVYKQIKGKFGGCFMLTSPTIIFKDLELLKTIMVKDFDHFADRGFHIDEENDPLSGHLLALTDQKWRRMRQKLTPTFTTGKIKALFPTALKKSNTLHKYITGQSDNVHEMRELLQRYTMDIIASVVFGIDINCIEEPNLEFNVMARKLTEPNFKNSARFFLTFMIPKLVEILKIKSVEDDLEKYWIAMVKQTIDYREKNKIVREDFMQLLLQMRNNGKLEEDGKWNVDIVEGIITIC